MAEYSVLCEYIEVQMDRIGAGKEVVVEIRNLETFERMVVKAFISPSVDELPDSEPLFIEEYGGDLREKPWAIKIVEELNPDEVESTVFRDFRRRG